MKFLVRGKNVLSQEEISCHRKTLLVTGMNFMPQLEISCYRKKYLVTGKNFLSQDEIPCQRHKCLDIQEEISCHRKKLLVTGKNFMPQLKISCHRKKYPNYRNFGHLLSHMTPAVSGEIFGWKYWLPRSKIFYPTLAPTTIYYMLESNNILLRCSIPVGLDRPKKMHFGMLENW